MPLDTCLGWNWIKAHFLMRRRFASRQLCQHAKGFFFEKAREVISFSNFTEATILNFSPFSHKISLNCVTTCLDGYFCASYRGIFITMVRTRSGISTAMSAKKEKMKMKAKDVKKKGHVPESNKRGVRVRGM